MRWGSYNRCRVLRQFSLYDDYDVDGDLFLFYSFLMNKIAYSSVVSKDTGDFVSSYTPEEQIHMFQYGVDILL